MYKLLIADDEPIERETLKIIVDRHFPDIAIIGEAGNGREAIIKTRELHPDIVFLDVKMPGITGVEAAKVIKDENKAVKIVIITAYDYFEYAKESLKAGIDDFLLKPALKENIQEVLARLKQQIGTEKSRLQADADLHDKLKSMTVMIEKETISAILSRLNESEITEYFNLLDVKLDWAVGFIAAVNQPEALAGAADKLQRKIYNTVIYGRILKELKALDLQIISAPLNNQLYGLILSSSDPNEYEQKIRLLQLIEAAKDQALEQSGARLTIGVGSAYDQAARLNDSFLEAELALGYTAAAPGIIHYGDINLKLRAQEYPFQDEKRFCEEIINGNLEKSRTYMEKLLNWFILNCASVEESRRKLFELVVMLTRAAAIFENIDPALLDTVRYFEEIKNLLSMAEIEAYLERLCFDFTDNIRYIRQAGQNSQIRKALEFIAVNYAKDLTLEEVAGVVCLSSPYFSKIFKQETGENFIDYLTKYRLKVAENILKNKQCSVKDVCYQVGYNDPNYFGKIFKKYYGVNPSEYKLNN